MLGIADFACRRAFPSWIFRPFLFGPTRLGHMRVHIRPSLDQSKYFRWSEDINSTFANSSSLAVLEDSYSLVVSSQPRVKQISAFVHNHINDRALFYIPNSESLLSIKVTSVNGFNLSRAEYEDGAIRFSSTLLLSALLMFGTMEYQASPNLQNKKYYFSTSLDTINPTKS